MRRSWWQVPTGGVAVETTRWGPGPAVSVLAVHATGLCKEVLRPVVRHLMDREPSGQFIAMDQRAHGDSPVPPPPYPWSDAAGDVLAVVAATNGLAATNGPDAREGSEAAAEATGGVVGFGHSSGAAQLVLAELAAPGTFDALVLAEPIIFPADVGDTAAENLVRSALRRRSGFADRAAAAANFAEKPAFTGWDPEAFDAYLDHGLVPGPDGLRLKCPPEAEAEFYRESVRHGGWNRLGEVGCPVVLVAGEHSNSHTRPFLEAQARRFRRVDAVEVVAGASHFVVMERPEAMAALLAGTIRRLRHR